VENLGKKLLTTSQDNACQNFENEAHHRPRPLTKQIQKRKDSGRPIKGGGGSSPKWKKKERKTCRKEIGKKKNRDKERAG